ncbi:MAG: hypothetical protein ACK5NN_00200 [Sphingomonadaceae bacterium]
MFKISSDPKFTHDVKVMVPVDGGHSEQSFKVTYRVVDADEMMDTADLEGQTALLRRIVCHMDDLIGEDKQKVEYSDDLRDRLIRVPYIRSALLQSYLRAVTKAREGN